MLSKQQQPSTPVTIMSLSGLSGAGRKLVSYVLGQTVAISLHAAAIGSALYCFTQLLPEEDMVLSDFVYDAQTPLETSEDGTLYKARRWAECKGVYKLTLLISKFSSQREQEAAILQRTKGVPNLQQYITHEATQRQPGSFSLIMERLQSGSRLSSLLNTTMVQLSTSQRISMACQVMHDLLLALEGLHRRGIAHGDITADSVYVTVAKTDDGQRTFAANLIDFSSAVQFQADERVLDGKLLELEGRDPQTIAPEVLVRTSKGADTGYPISASAADIWSAAVLLVLMAAKQPPFETADGSVRDLIKQHRTWEGAVQQRRGSHPLLKSLDAAPKEFARLAVRMLQVDPARRITAAQALKHPCFNDSSSSSKSS